jgi:hypothetical protein
VSAKRSLARMKRPSRPRAVAPIRPGVARARVWAPLADPAPGAKDPIYVSFLGPPDEEALAEAASYVATLEANRQIARNPEQPDPDATHAIERDARGHRRLVRKRFSAR